MQINESSLVKTCISIILFIALVVASVGGYIVYGHYDRSREVFDNLPTQGILDDIFTTNYGKGNVIVYSLRVYDSHGDIMHIEIDSSKFSKKYTVGSKVPLLIKKSDSGYYMSRDEVYKMQKFYRVYFIVCGVSILCCILSLGFVLFRWDEMTLKVDNNRPTEARSNRVSIQNYAIPRVQGEYKVRSNMQPRRVKAIRDSSYTCDYTNLRPSSEVLSSIGKVKMSKNMSGAEAFHSASFDDTLSNLDINLFDD